MSLYQQRIALDTLLVFDVILNRNNELLVCVNNGLSISDGFNHFTFLPLQDVTQPITFTNSGGAAGRLFVIKVGTVDAEGGFVPDVAP